MSCIDKFQNTDRQPAVAGAFYPASQAELTHDLQTYFEGLNPNSAQNPLAVIVPHAGYVFSGRTAATAYAQINRNATFQHIFVVGSSHTMHFRGAAIYPNGNFVTPLGKVPVDELAAELIAKYPVFNANMQPHQQEHSLEVQLPFLQHWLKNRFKIVPIVIGGEAEQTCAQVANALAPYLTPENLFIVSSDFAHYPTRQIAEQTDAVMADAICTNSVAQFMSAKQKIETSGHPNLLTAMCGWTSMLSLLNITQGRNDLIYKKISYTNSANSPYGDNQRVVGYNALALFAQKPLSDKSFSLSNEAKKELLEIARQAIERAVRGKSDSSGSTHSPHPELQQLAGAFVTLHLGGHLRGCIGNFATNRPLAQVVDDMAQAAATHDYRFTPVTAPELDQIKIEISVLTPMQRIHSADQLQLGKHGIYMRRGMQSGTFLPQVATETNWTKEQFLGHCARDKAGLGWDDWRNDSTELYVYEAIVFNEDDLK